LYRYAERCEAFLPETPLYTDNTMNGIALVFAPRWGCTS
jgi:hypothetical protein